MKTFLVIAAAAIVLLVASCDVEFRWWTAAGDSNVPAAQEVNKVIDAAYRDSLDETLSNLYLTINRADKGTRQGAFIIDHEVPGLAARIDELIPAASQRVAAVRVETPAGQQFRGVVQRGLVRQRLLYRTFAADLAGKRPTWKAFDRWAASFNALHSWYVLQFRSILAAAAFEDRAPLAAALRRY